MAYYQNWRRKCDSKVLVQLLRILAEKCTFHQPNQLDYARNGGIIQILLYRDYITVVVEGTAEFPAAGSVRSFQLTGGFRGQRVNGVVG